MAGEVPWEGKVVPSDLGRPGSTAHVQVVRSTTARHLVGDSGMEVFGAGEVASADHLLQSGKISPVVPVRGFQGEGRHAEGVVGMWTSTMVEV